MDEIMYLFDLCIITTSSLKQAKQFQEMIERRLKHGLYPREIDFKIYPDPQKGRIGCGGSTLISLYKLIKEYKVKDPLSFFKSRKILLIHAGGESRRLPCYMPEGKIFAPVPAESSSIFPPVTLDLQLSLFFKYPWQKGEILITSGDVIIDFDADLIPEYRGDICCFAKSSPLEQGTNHGVFVYEPDQLTITDYLQKPSIKYLMANALLEGTNECALDMGLISLSPEMANSLIELSDQTFINDSSLLSLLKNCQLSFNLYLEFMTACVRKLSFKDYYDRVHTATNLGRKMLLALYESFHNFNMEAILTSSTTFIHVGSLLDFPKACEEIINKKITPFYVQQNEEIKVKCSSSFISYNSQRITVKDNKHKKSIFENSHNVTIKNTEGNNLFTGLKDWSSDMVIPEGICIDQRYLGERTIRLVYSINDNFRPAENTSDIIYCNISLHKWLEDRQLTEKDIWPEGKKYDLITARLFVPDASYDFLEGYWKKPESQQWSVDFRKFKRLSIQEVNEQDDVLSREHQRIIIRKEILQSLYLDNIGWKNTSIHDFKKAFHESRFQKPLMTFYSKTDNILLKSYRRTLLSSITKIKKRETIEPTFGTENTGINPNSLGIGVKEDQIVWARSPVRIDLAGGWSDTPPHTLRLGGQVVNFAANLNGQPPIHVFCRRTETKHIRIHSIDLGKTETIKTFQKLEDYKRPKSPFALPKASLCLIGFSKAKRYLKTLEEFLSKIGCGLEITLLCSVPKGSGLGTSSILGATILAALYRFFNLPFSREDLFGQVLKLEQMLTTGGGWQDQIGGIVGSIKYIESKPGYKPNFLIHQLDPYLLQNDEMHGYFTLFYTGFTRLAKNILKEVVEQANSNTPSYIFTLKYIKQLALNTKNAVSARDLPMLAEILFQSWEANKKIHYNATNETIDEMLGATRAYYIGVKLLGAGGGGYALFISRNLHQGKALKQLLEKEYSNEKARLVDFSLNMEGLQVSVS